jgi:beta-lactamase regulating signal transducer with metallopeptidase domain
MRASVDFSAIADAWWTYVSHSVWQSSLVAVLVLVFVWVLHKRSAAFLYAVLLVGLLKFLVPPLIALPVLDVEPMTAAPVSVQPMQIGNDAMDVDAGMTQSMPSVNRTQMVEANSVSSGVTVNKQAVIAWPHNWKTLLATLHIAGSGLLISLMFASYVRLVKVLRTSRPAENKSLLLAMKETGGLLGLLRPVELRISPSACAPMATGLIWRRIIVPKALTDTLQASELRAILGHELAHHRRLDVWCIWLEHLVLLLWWFNPLVWLLIRALHQKREDCCDDIVLSTGLAGNSGYCETLLHAAKQLQNPFAPRLLFGCASKLHPMGWRLMRIMDSAARRRVAMTVSSVVGIVVLGFVLLPTFMPVAAVQAVQVTPTQESQESVADTSQKPQSEESIEPVEKEIRDHYAIADPDVQEYVRKTAHRFGKSGLWLPENAFDTLTSDQREQKVNECFTALMGEYSRELCPALAAAGVLKDDRLLLGVLKAAAYHRDDQDYDCRPKWIAVEAAGRFGDVLAVPALIPLVDHGNENTRMWARASLVRLTGQNFSSDKQAWGKWWNDSGKGPKIDSAQLKPWTMPGGAQAASAAGSPAIVPTDSNAIIESAVGKPDFKLKYSHRSRGQEIAPTVVWLRGARDAEVVAATYLPAFTSTYVARIAPGKGLYSYETHSQKPGIPASLSLMDLSPGFARVKYTGGERDGQSDNFTVPQNAMFVPNSRPDPYVAHMALFFNGAITKSQEWSCYDWDNTGKGMASYTSKLENTGQESVTVPAGTFTAHHIVETHQTFGDTWYKKRPGHITEYWVLDNGVTVRILRHREPYELVLASAEPALQPNVATAQPAHQSKVSSESKFVVHGTVTGGDGNPMPGVEVVAHSGIGTLKHTGAATTGPDGTYRLEFDYGMHIAGGGFVVACFFASKPGYYEQNLCRHADLAMGEVRPEKQDEWPAPDKVIVRGESRRIDFAMLPAAKVLVKVVDSNGAPLVNHSLDVRGDELPPASSVLFDKPTDADGIVEFEMPCKRFWFVLQKEIDGHPAETASLPINFATAGDYNLKLTFNPALEVTDRLKIAPESLPQS